jgi:hypothetical protein
VTSCPGVLRVVDGLPVRVVERLPEPDPRDHVLNWSVNVLTDRKEER